MDGFSHTVRYIFFSYLTTWPFELLRSQIGTLDWLKHHLTFGHTVIFKHRLLIWKSYPDGYFCITCNYKYIKNQINKRIGLGSKKGSKRIHRHAFSYIRKRRLKIYGQSKRLQPIFSNKQYFDRVLRNSK